VPLGAAAGSREQHAAEGPDDEGEGIAVCVEAVEKGRKQVKGRGDPAGADALSGQSHRFASGAFGPPGAERLVVQLLQLSGRKLADAIGEEAKLPCRLA
jgi:hypothetical protein